MKKQLISLFLIFVLLLSFCTVSYAVKPATLSLKSTGDNVKSLQKSLISLGYLKGKADGVFGSKTEEAVKKFQKDNNLEPTGMLDDDTLTLLIWDMLPEKLDRVMPLVSGKPSTYPDTVYIPTDGGKKRHATRECCNMEDPRKVSIRNAEEIGFDACKIKYCERYVELTLH